MYRFIAIVGHAVQSGEERRPDPDAVLSTLGLTRRVTASSLSLFASDETPVLELSEAGIVVGHLFSRSFTPVDYAALAPPSMSPALLRKHLLEHYWGEYVFLQSLEENDALAVLREPSGGMPCFYRFVDGSGFVTSDISLATRLGLFEKRIDWDVIVHSLTYPNLKTQRTGLVGIRELLPGCVLTVASSSVNAEVAWSPWAFVGEDRRFRDLSEAAASVRTAVTSVVKTWAEADRAILVELSGGLDSSIVAASLRGCSARIICCTLAAPLLGGDEREYARPVTEYLGVDLQEQELDFERSLFKFDLTVATPTPCVGGLRYIASSVMSEIGALRGTVSNISGGGGDTIFCYLTTAAPAADALRERGLTAALRSVHDLSMLHQCTFWKAGWLTAKRLFRSHNAYRDPVPLLLNPAVVTGTAGHHPWFDAPPSSYIGDRERIYDLSGTQRLREGALRGIDRWLRMPLLSQPVVEACLRTPTWMWIAGGRNRAVAREAFADILPPKVLNRRSKGTFMGYLGAAYQRNKHAMQDFLLSGLLHQKGILDAAALNGLITGPQTPRDQSFVRVFELCTVENWLRQQD